MKGVVVGWSQEPVSHGLVSEMVSVDLAMIKIRGLGPRPCRLEASFADLRELAPVRLVLLWVLRFGRISVQFARFRFECHSI